METLHLANKEEMCDSWELTNENLRVSGKNKINNLEQLW